MQKKTSLLFLMLFVLLLSGCGLFQASPEEIKKYQQDFVDLVDKASKEAENGQKVLNELREKVDKEGLKKIKVQDKLSQATDIAQAIKDDVVQAQLPQEMEPIREKLMSSLDERMEAYNQLFLYYDFMEQKYREKGDALLADSFRKFKEVQAEIEKYRN